MITANRIEMGQWPSHRLLEIAIGSHDGRGPPWPGFSASAIILARVRNLRNALVLLVKSSQHLPTVIYLLFIAFQRVVEPSAASVKTAAQLPIFYCSQSDRALTIRIVKWLRG